MKYSLLFAAAALSALPLTGLAQTPAATPAVDGGGAPPAAPDARRGGGGGPEQFRQRMLDNLKGMLKASDDEFAVIQPLVEKVYTKQREARGGFGGGGRPPRGGGDRPPGEAGGGEERRGPRPGGGDSPESQALRDALKDDNSSASDISTKLAALRDQRKKAAVELAAARADLSKVLTVRQEAVLVQIGLLE